MIDREMYSEALESCQPSITNPTVVLVLNTEAGENVGLLEDLIPNIIKETRPDLRAVVTHDAEAATEYLVWRRMRVAGFISSCYPRGGCYNKAHYSLPPVTEAALALATLPVALVSRADPETLNDMMKLSRGNNFLGSIQSIKLHTFADWVRALDKKPLILNFERTIDKTTSPVNKSLRFFKSKNPRNQDVH